MAEGLMLFAAGLTSTNSKEANMTFCGYNRKMAQGLETFSSGLAVQTEKRAQEESVSIPKIPAIELAELDRMIASLLHSKKKSELTGIIGLGMFVRYLYAKIQEVTAANPSVSAHVAFEQVVEEFNKLMFEMEDHYYKELRPEFGIERAIEMLTPYLEARI